MTAESTRPDLWNAVSGDFARLVESFRKKEYDFVLTASPRLQEHVENMTCELQKDLALRQIERLTAQIAELRAAASATSAPGRLEEMERSLSGAMTYFEQGSYGEAIQIIRRAQGSLADETVKILDIETNVGPATVRVFGDEKTIETIRAALARSEGVVIKAVRTSE